MKRLGQMADKLREPIDEKEAEEEPESKPTPKPRRKKSGWAYGYK